MQYRFVAYREGQGVYDYDRDELGLEESLLFAEWWLERWPDDIFMLVEVPGFYNCADGTCEEYWCDVCNSSTKSFDLMNQPMRLKYTHPDKGIVVDAGVVKFDESWYDGWLNMMVGSNRDIIFFIVVESTDIFEQEWDLNTVSWMGDDTAVAHTPSAECPPGCWGQLEGCQYRLGV